MVVIIQVLGKYMMIRYIWNFPKFGHLFGGPYIKDCNALGLILGSAYFGKLPYLPGVYRDLGFGD